MSVSLNGIYQVYPQDGGKPFPVQVWRVTLVAEADGTASATVEGDISRRGLAGEVSRIEILPNTLAASATIKMHDGQDLLSSPPLILDYTVPSPAVEATIYPVVQATDNTGSAVTGEYRRYAVCGGMSVALASADENDEVTLLVYVI